MSEQSPLSQQVALLHAYHLDLWSEIEAQLRTLRASQREIEELRKLRTIDETPALSLGLAELLAGHARTLSGRAQTLSTTIAELERTVGDLVEKLRAAV